MNISEFVVCERMSNEELNGRVNSSAYFELIVVIAKIVRLVHNERNLLPFPTYLFGVC